MFTFDVVLLEKGMNFMSIVLGGVVTSHDCRPTACFSTCTQHDAAKSSTITGGVEKNHDELGQNRGIPVAVDSLSVFTHVEKVPLPQIGVRGVLS